MTSDNLRWDDAEVHGESIDRFGLSGVDCLRGAGNHDEHEEQTQPYHLQPFWCSPVPRLAADAIPRQPGRPDDRAFDHGPTLRISTDRNGSTSVPLHDWFDYKIILDRPSPWRSLGCDDDCVPLLIRYNC